MELQHGGRIELENNHPMIHRGDDAVEYLIPVAWKAVADATKKISEGVENIPAAISEMRDILDRIASGYFGRVEVRPIKHTLNRKKIRWNERNRRRNLKGLPEKPNPYDGIFCYTMVINPVAKNMELNILTDSIRKGACTGRNDPWQRTRTRSWPE